jgi:SAM-dependent methyltransferase
MNQDQNGRASREKVLRQLYGLNARLGMMRFLRGLDYVRCTELPLVYEGLELTAGMRVLDVGCRGSVFPAFLAARGARVHALDLDVTVVEQRETARRLGLAYGTSLLAVRGDMRRLPYPDGCFDRVSLVSTIEHVPGEGDTQGIRELARVLRPGGRIVLTVPYGDSERDFFLEEKVYSQEFRGEAVFFQRHYDEQALRSRLVGPSGLTEIRRAYFGEHRRAFFNTFWVLPRWLRPVKVLYNWMGPYFARKYSGVFEDSTPLLLRHPPMVNANGVFLVLQK